MGVLDDLRDAVGTQLATHFGPAVAPTGLQRTGPPSGDRDDEAAPADHAPMEAAAAAADLDVSVLNGLGAPTRTALTAAGRLGMTDAVALVQALVPSAEAFALPNDRVVAYAAQRAAELVGKRVLADGSVVDNPDARYAITESTRQQLRATLTTAFRDEWTHAQVQDALASHYAFSATRARLIAQTEISDAFLEANRATAEASGVVTGKESILGSEHDADDECDTAAADGVIPLGADFSNGQSGPTYHPGCRCDLLYHVAEDA